MSREALERAVRRQARILSIPPALPTTPKQLFADISRHLSIAFDDGLLTTHPSGLLRTTKDRPDDDVEILGGDIDPPERGLRQFARADGVYFNFGVIVTPATASVILHSYRFHVVFPETEPTKMLRFDLNPVSRGHNPSALRCHLHVNANDEKMLIPSPFLSPLEILDVIVYELQLTGRDRAR